MIWIIHVATLLFVHRLVHANNMETVKAPHCWSFLSGIHRSGDGNSQHKKRVIRTVLPCLDITSGFGTYTVNDAKLWRFVHLISIIWFCYNTVNSVEILYKTQQLPRRNTSCILNSQNHPPTDKLLGCLFWIFHEMDRVKTGPRCFIFPKIKSAGEI